MTNLQKLKLPMSLIAAAVTILIAVEGTWGFQLHRHWTFIVLMVALMIALGITIASECKGKSFCALASHLGLLLILIGGLFGAAYRSDEQVRLFADGEVVEVPFKMSLEEFSIDYYDDGVSPKQFTSRLNIDGNSKTSRVNHPGRYKGYRIYQSGYDEQCGEYSVLKIVRDPWIPVVALGALLLLAGALMGLKKVWSSWKTLVAALILALVFGILSLARINFGALPPALRSIWFAPHLIVYMLAYSVMAISVITGIASGFSSRIPGHLPGKLLSTSSALLLIGMLFGAVWAQQAWGNYWTWDAKECWAAVTWLLTLAGIHTGNNKARLAFTILAFLAMQMTWYGVNYLPAAQMSLHTY